MKYIVQYTLPYEHRVMVGIEAGSAKEAVATAELLFDQGDIWLDTAQVPLLYDDYEETGDAPLLFSVEQELEDDEPWPEPDASVTALRRREAAFLASRLLATAYHLGAERGGSIDWEELDLAYEAAVKAVGEDEVQNNTSPRTRSARIAVILEGGIVQGVVADRPDAAPAVAVVDYDVDGCDPEDIRHITQSDGEKSKALVVEHHVEPASIDLDDIFRNAGH